MVKNTYGHMPSVYTRLETIFVVYLFEQRDFVVRNKSGHKVLCCFFVTEIKQSLWFDI